MKSLKQKRIEALVRWEERLADCVRGKRDGVTLNEGGRVEYWVSRSEVAVKQIQILRRILGIKEQEAG